MNSPELGGAALGELCKPLRDVDLLTLLVERQLDGSAGLSVDGLDHIDVAGVCLLTHVEPHDTKIVDGQAHRVLDAQVSRSRTAFRRATARALE